MNQEYIDWIKDGEYDRLSQLEQLRQISIAGVSNWLNEIPSPQCVLDAINVSGVLEACGFLRVRISPSTSVNGGAMLEYDSEGVYNCIGLFNDGGIVHLVSHNEDRQTGITEYTSVGSLIDDLGNTL